MLPSPKFRSSIRTATLLLFVFCSIARGNELRDTRGVALCDRFPGADAGAQIAACIESLPPSGGIADAREFSGAHRVQNAITVGLAGRTKPVTLLLGGATFITEALITVENESHIIGIGTGTKIVAGSSFPSNSPLVRLGSTTPISTATVEKLTINCSLLPESTGAYNEWAQELSGFVDVTVQNCTSRGIWVEGSNAQNSYLRNIYVLCGNATSSTIGVYIHNVIGFRGLENATIASNDGSIEGIGLSIDGSNGFYEGIHIESSLVGIDIGATVNSVVSIRNVTGGSSTTPTLIRIENVHLNRVMLEAIASLDAPTTISDLMNGIVITDTWVDRYETAETPSFLVGPGAAMTLGKTKFLLLGNQRDGSLVYCPDCAATNPCQGNGAGALAKKFSGRWVCN